ncbi:putative nucleotide-binding alpha-beta plait domain-containing protein [Medicago truncatula]|uniref:Putative nucleotide-binding alpha-beta plait domain-containing protein n=1 Tax=Medicago truncatula TaxID=3880 RepID=A0A396I6P2_MEDTR|nr:putative nucleotide-binding alpha-beta plait domain-containing protein [Medicago truncatula]
MASADVEYRCFVGGLAWATDSEALEKAFSQYGEIIDSKIINDRETGRSRGFGFVTFADEKSMRDAIEGMNGQDMDGRNITVNEAQRTVVMVMMVVPAIHAVVVVMEEAGEVSYADVKC